MIEFIEKAIIFDCEVYRNYFLVSFMRVGDSKLVSIGCSGEDSALTSKDISKLRSILENNVTVGFNSINYDLPIISYALMGKSCSQIKDLSDYMIGASKNVGWMTMRDKEIEPARVIKHIDIANVAAGVGVSLKLYGARMACKTLQELPIDPAKTLTQDEMGIISKYCTNDLVLTRDLFLTLEEQVLLRKKMSSEHELDLMSKSDAQIAEAIIRVKVGKVGKYEQPESVRYTPPPYIKFRSNVLSDLLKQVASIDYVVGSDTGKLFLPEELKNPVTVGGREYTIGLGGIHSKEKCQSVTCPPSGRLAEVDVASYYPNLILNMEVKPAKLGATFLKVYKELVDERLIAKRAGDKSKSDSLKIVVNGTFGKLGSKWSAMYDPTALLSVTLTGQLSLLMLIEKLTIWGVEVVSANTDGVVCLVRENQITDYEQLCSEWEEITRLELEETLYSALYSRDVSNYLAIKPDGSYKGKGVFANRGTQKNPQGDICVDAVIKCIAEGAQIEKTIIDNKDIRKFIFVRTVKGGAEWNFGYLGKVVRWVYVEGGSEISYVKNGNKVPKSDGSYPVMALTETSCVDDLPEQYPIDYQRYIEEAKSILKSIGYVHEI